MRICFFSIVTYWHGLRGGMQNHNKLLLEGLAERGHEITVISTCHPDGIQSEQRNNLTLYYLSNTQFGSARKGWKSQSLNIFSHLNQTKNFDLICSQGPFFPPIREHLIKNIPLVTLVQAHEAWVMLSEINQFVTLRTNFPDVTRRILSFIYYYLKWEVSNFQKSDLIIPPSHEVAKSLQSWYFIKPDKIKTIYNAVDTKHFKPDSKAKRRILKQYPQLKRKKIILFLSHVTKQKGLHLLIKILPSLVNQHPNLTVIVVGGGDYLEQAKKNSFELGVADQMVFTDMVEIDTIPDYINAADIFVLPTLRREGLPLSILEVMACKKPVITTNIGGNTSVIKNGINGVLIPPKNMHQLEQSIILLLNNEKLASKLAQKGYESIIENFELKKMLDCYETLLSEQVDVSRKSKI